LVKLKDTMQKRNLQNGYGRSLSIVPNVSAMSSLGIKSTDLSIY
jgi:hypothetical protein